MFYVKPARMVKSLEEALTPEALIFGLTVGNIPTMNLRGQYAHDRQMIIDRRLNDTGVQVSADTGGGPLI